LQSSVLANENRAYLGIAPLLNEIKFGFGQNVAGTWLMVQIEDLNTFCGVKEKANQAQMLELSKLIIVTYYFLKISELMLFFAKFKLGEYGKFFGVVDPIVIMAALNKFSDDRIGVLNRLKKEEKAKEYEKVFIPKPNDMTREEYNEVKWLFNM
jgi:hypothetical protein